MQRPTLTKSVAILRVSVAYGQILLCFFCGRQKKRRNSIYSSLNYYICDNKKSMGANFGMIPKRLTR